MVRVARSVVVVFVPEPLNGDRHCWPIVAIWHVAPSFGVQLDWLVGTQGPRSSYLDRNEGMEGGRGSVGGSWRGRRVGCEGQKINNVRLGESTNRTSKKKEEEEWES